MSWHVFYHYKKVLCFNSWWVGSNTVYSNFNISTYYRYLWNRKNSKENVHISDLYIQKKLLGAVECKNTVYDIFHYRGPSLRRIYTWMSNKNTVTVLRVFAIKPMIIIAWRLVHSFCVFHKKFNGQQFFQEALYNNHPMTSKIHSK